MLQRSSKISLKTIFKSIKPLAVIIIITSVLNLFYGQGEPLVTLFGRLKITEAGICTAIFMTVRIILLVVVGSLLTYTTTPTDLTDAIERLMKPLNKVHFPVHEIAMMMSLALRFVPTLLEETDKIMQAQKARGADLEGGNVIARIKALIPILVPLFVSSFRRAYDLATAMECRCYHGGEGRTRMKSIHMAKRDVIGLITVGLVVCGVVLCNILIPAVL